MPLKPRNPCFSRERAFRFGINGPSRFSRFVPAIMFQWLSDAGGRLMGEPATDQERWAEREAVQFERSADYLLKECLTGWLERGAVSQHPDSYRMCYEVALKAQNYRDMARQLRQPRYIREEQEAYAKFYAPTPDRSGEADKTGTGLAEGESGLPEGSS